MMISKSGFRRIAMLAVLFSGVTSTAAAQVATPARGGVGAPGTVLLPERQLGAGVAAWQVEEPGIAPLVWDDQPLVVLLGLGAAAGSLVGFAAGALLMASAKEWIAPPAFHYTVPAGAALGAVGGLVVYMSRWNSPDS